MSQLRWFALLGPAALLMLAAPPGSGETGEPASVIVTNFPETQQVEGTVSVTRPVPATRLEKSRGLVTPAAPTDLNSLTDGGTLDATGFVSATLSLAVEVQGSLAAPARVGAILVPDVPEVLAAMRNAGVVQFPLTTEAAVTPSPTGVHQAAPVTVRLAFPRYRVFFYNTTPRTSEATLYSYLSSS